MCVVGASPAAVIAGSEAGQAGDDEDNQGQTDENNV